MIGSLPELVASSGATALAVVGLVKNAGKTTVINCLLADCPQTLGLTSLGLDGEASDHLTGLPKPRIAPPAGTLVATTSGSLARAPYEMVIVEQLPLRTPLGPVVIGRAKGHGRVEVSGPTTLAELRLTVDRLHAHGAGLVLVDGAINRMGSASPRVSDALVLASGGVAGDTLEETVATTSATLELLSLPGVPPGQRDRLMSLLDRGERLVALDTQGRLLPLREETTVGADAVLAREIVRSGTGTLLVGGALTDHFLDSLTMVLPPRARLRIVVRDATAVIAPAGHVARCRQRGISLEALTPLRVLAVTTNPFRLPRPFPPEVFFRAVVEGVGDRLPVFDVVSRLAFNSGVPGTPASVHPPCEEVRE